MLNIGIGTTLVLLDLAMVWATKTTVDIATHQSTFTTLPHALALLALIMALRLVLGLSMRWIRAILGVKALNTMQRYIFGRLLRGRWETLRRFHTGNLFFIKDFSLFFCHIITFGSLICICTNPICQNTIFR